MENKLKGLIANCTIIPSLASIKSDGTIELIDEFALNKKKNYEAYNDFMKKLYAYENCDISYGKECKEPHCKFAVLHFENNKTICFTCGRKDK